MPRLSVLPIESALWIVLEAEEEAGAGEDCLDGEDEPGVLGNDVGDQEVDLGRGVGDYVAVGTAVGVDVIAAVEDRGGGFHLDAPEVFSGVDDEVVAFAVAEGRGQAESQGSGFQDKGHFSELAASLGSGLALVGGFLIGCGLDGRDLALAREGVVFFHGLKRKGAS